MEKNMNNNFNLQDILNSNRNWTEDYTHENGKYVNFCTICGEPFMGHKRRVVCKECDRHNEENNKLKAINKNIITGTQHTVLSFKLSDFRGAMAYWLIAQEPDIDIDINKPLEAFTRYLKNRFFHNSDDIIAFSYDRLSRIISEDVFMAIPELMTLNKLNPNFYDLGVLARNVLSMMWRIAND
jgi:hypothetical protein